MEKTQSIVSGIEGFDSTKLRHTETNEKNPLPDQDGKSSSSSLRVVLLHKSHGWIIYDNCTNLFILSNFLMHEMKNVCFISRFSLFYFSFSPFYQIKKAVQAEKSHQQFINGVEHFDKTSMKHTETEEKNPLPDVNGKW